MSVLYQKIPVSCFNTQLAQPSRTCLYCSRHSRLRSRCKLFTHTHLQELPWQAYFVCQPVIATPLPTLCVFSVQGSTCILASLNSVYHTRKVPDANPLCQPTGNVFIISFGIAVYVYKGLHILCLTSAPHKIDL